MIMDYRCERCKTEMSATAFRGECPVCGNGTVTEIYFAGDPAKNAFAGDPAVRAFAGDPSLLSLRETGRDHDTDPYPSGKSPKEQAHGNAI